MEEIIKIAAYIFESFLHIWPYLLVTIPLAVLVKQSGAAKLIHKALSRNPLVSILLATLVGAISPFCSCGVIPVISSLLIGGVPLAPVMSFWIASPSMDPEIFFLSTASIGWELSVWRLAATFAISLSAGYITHILVLKGLLGRSILRTEKAIAQLAALGHSNNGQVAVNCCIDECSINSICQVDESQQPQRHQDTKFHQRDTANRTILVNFRALVSWWHEADRRKLLKETWQATSMVLKFMGLAFFINALINFYVPKDFLTVILNGNSSVSVLIATLAGIPAYTTNITALPLISGLLKLGMNPGAALAFLIAGPVTTLPAMVAVWGIASRKVFILYLGYCVLGALITGLLFNLVHTINFAPVEHLVSLFKIIASV
jgi:uncharacterized protein